MLSKENNDLLTQTGPKTRMGDFLRLFWLPAFLVEELPESDCPPVRVRLLGEKLVAFRDSNGNIGLMEEACPHRGASLVYGRSEEGGLRCIYHGWKLDTGGNVVEMPCERGDVAAMERIKQTSYPTREAGGIVWAYLGPNERMPPFPNFEWMNLPASQVHVQKVLIECNYLQSIEGGIDSAHISFLHRTEINYGHIATAARDTAPEFEVQEMPYGFRYAALRNRDKDNLYVRITPFIMPFYTIVPFAEHQPQAQHAWVPADDHYNWAYTFTFKRNEDLKREEWTHAADMVEGYRRYRNVGNQHLQDRAAMKTGRSFSGIPEILDQDAAVQESMGFIVDRTKEHLRKTDAAIVHLRRLFLRKLDAAEGDKSVNQEAIACSQNIRCNIGVIPVGADWRTLA
ncbi:MAG: Rieske 2Fe-2S domain-containing protein [Burkholderiales bacterium]